MKVHVDCQIGVFLVVEGEGFALFVREASEASEKVVMVSVQKITQLMEMPFSTDPRKDSRRVRSRIVELDSLTFLMNLARDSILCRLFMKCVASRMMKQRWFSFLFSD